MDAQNRMTASLKLKELCKCFPDKDRRPHSHITTFQMLPSQSCPELYQLLPFFEEEEAMSTFGFQGRLGNRTITGWWKQGNSEDLKGLADVRDKEEEEEVVTTQGKLVNIKDKSTCLALIT